MSPSKVLTISKFTFIEIYKSRVMINVLLSGLLLALFCYVVSEFTFGNPAKVALDVGLGFLSLTTKGIALFFGATLLKKEIGSRTIYLILSNPVERSEFLIGKFFGLSGILFLNTLILSIFTTGFYYYWEGVWTSLIAWSILQIFMESLLILLIVIFFSLITNVNLAIVFSIVIYISGYTIRSVQELSKVKENKALAAFTEYIAYVIPNFSLFDIKSFVLYKQELSFNYLFSTFGYSTFYIVLLVAACSMILKNKDLD